MTLTKQDIPQTEIQGFDETDSTRRQDKAWQPVSDRKIRVGIAGYGVSRFGAAFGLQHHPNVEIAAVCDISPERCAELAAACACQKPISPWRKWSKISRWRLSSWVRTLLIMHIMPFSA